MDETPNIYGSEEGWAEASTDSRRDQKQRDIKALVSRMESNEKAAKAAQEQEFFDELVEAAGPVVHAGLERSGSTTGYSRRYAANFDKVFKEN